MDLMTEQRSLPVRMWFGFWRTLDLTRKIILNLIFFGLLYLLFLALMPQGPQRVDADTTLILRPYGNVVEQYSGSPVDRLIQEATDQAPIETRLRDLVTAIDRAAKDSHVTQMVIDTDYLGGVGMASLLELEQAVQRFKQSGKPVIATAGTLGQQQYYLAALADEIWLDPEGLVWIDGFSNYRNFYREGLEKLEVEVNLFRVGEYKSAMEPFIRDDMSEEAKEAALFWIGGLWQQYLEGISRLRGIPLESLNAAIVDFADRLEAAEGDFARMALEVGLVDRLVAAPEARSELARMGAANLDGDSYRAVGVEAYLQSTTSMSLQPQSGAIAVVVAEGEIMSGQHSPGKIGSVSISSQLREAGPRRSSGGRSRPCGTRVKPWWYPWATWPPLAATGSPWAATRFGPARPALPVPLAYSEYCPRLQIRWAGWEYIPTVSEPRRWRASYDWTFPLMPS
jgi:protease-4